MKLRIMTNPVIDCTGIYERSALVQVAHELGFAVDLIGANSVLVVGDIHIDDFKNLMRETRDLLD